VVCRSHARRSATAHSAVWSKRRATLHVFLKLFGCMLCEATASCRVSSRMQPPTPYNATCDEDDCCCHCRKGPTCDPLRTCDPCLRVRGARLGCLYLSDLHLFTLEGLLPLFALALLAQGREHDELLDIADGQVARVCKKAARSLELKACRQQQIIASFLSLPAYTEDSDSGVLVVQSAQDWMRYDASRAMNRA
jgi:hypothetical protein